MDNIALLKTAVGYEADTGLFYWREFTSQDLIDLGFTAGEADQIVNSGKFPQNADIEPAPVDAKGDKFAIRFTMAGHKVRVHTAVAAWTIATGETPDGTMLHIDGDPTNNTAVNLIHASVQAAKLLVRNYEGIMVRGNDAGYDEYQAVVRFYDEEGRRRSRSGAWCATQEEAVKERKALLVENGLWFAIRLSAVIDKD